MKYLKGTMLAFMATLIFSVSANALALTFSNITVPVLSKVYRSPEKVKTATTTQSIETINAVDKVSGDGRVIEAKVQGMNAGQTDSA